MNSETNGAASVKLPNLMKYLVIYLCFTVFLCFFGPIHFNIRNPGIMIAMLTAYHAALLIGYTWGTRRDIRMHPVVKEAEFTERDAVRVNRLILIGLFFDVLLLILVCGSINPATIFGKVIEGLLTPSTRYDNAFVETTARGSSIASLMVTLGMPFTIMALILSVFYFPMLKRTYKFLTITLYFFHVCYCLTQGANEGVFDVALYIGVAAFLGIQCRNVNRQIKHQKRKGKVLLIIAICLMAYLALNFFTTNIIGRTKANFAFGTLGENYYDKNAPINKYIPENLMVTLVYLSAYLCEGYYGMSLATTIEWIPNFGMGFSPFIRNNLSELMGIDLFQNSYQVRIGQQYNWGALRNFHTAYTFWANDVTYIGVVFIMVLLGYVFARCYRSGVLRQSKAAIVMMPLLVTMIFYLPANNKVFVQPASMLLMVYLAGYEFLKNISKKRY